MKLLLLDTLLGATWCQILIQKKYPHHHLEGLPMCSFRKNTLLGKVMQAIVKKKIKIKCDKPLKAAKRQYYPMSCLRRPYSVSVATSVFILQNRLQSGFKRRPRPAEPKVPRYVDRIRCFFIPQTDSSKYQLCIYSNELY